MDVMSCQSATDLELARALLIATRGATCIAVRGDDVLMSYERGVKPLLQWIAQGVSLSGYAVADKVVGKAPALLYATLGPDAVFGQVMTNDARAVLTSNGIKVSYDALASQIQNRAATGQCPIDASVKDVFDPYDALDVIKGRLAELARAQA